MVEIRWRQFACSARCEGAGCNCTAVSRQHAQLLIYRHVTRPARSCSAAGAAHSIVNLYIHIYYIIGKRPNHQLAHLQTFRFIPVMG